MASRLRPRHRWLLAAFLLVWGFCLVMRGRSLERMSPNHVYIEADAGGGYPVVAGYMSDAAEARSNLEVGDRLIRVGDRDLEGAGQLEYAVTLVAYAWEHRGGLPLEVEREGRRVTVDEARPPGQRGRRTSGLVISLVWGLVGVIILLRAPPTPESRALFYALASSAVLYTAAFEGPSWVFLISVAVSWLAVLVAQPFLIRAYLAFPEEASRLGGVHRFWPWAFALVGVFLFATEAGFPVSQPLASALATPAVLAYVLALLAVITTSYRRSGPVGRRQIKWVILAVYLGSLLAITTYAINGAVPDVQPGWMTVALTVASISYPISMLIAVLRFDLLDVDRLIGATVAYNLLAVAVIGAGFVLVPFVTEGLASTLGAPPAVGRSGVALALAGAVVVAHSRVRPQVDRFFFKERFALEQAMKELPEHLATATDAQGLWDTTGSELAAQLRPSGLVVYVAVGEVFVPFFVHGDAQPAMVPADGALVRWIAALDGATGLRTRDVRHLDEAGQLLLEGLDVRTVVPVHRAGRLEAFVTLGEKGSGDIYTGTDHTLLTALAKTLSIHLLRFSEAELLTRSREIQEQMRRYVPGAVADLIASGEEVETGAREVAVLFVDIRGYTRFSDGREASDIFSTVNRFTETVSTVVGRRGGVVVEFNGDGMMAVFGAPRPLEAKEAAAVGAARDIVEEVSRLGTEAELAEPLSVGVGVATGEVFVGNIQAADRTIWTAIGSTVNLAARLQALTREMDASILLDEPTHRAAGDPAGDFLRHDGVSIRGKRQARTLFGLPLAPA